MLHRYNLLEKSGPDCGFLNGSHEQCFFPIYLNNVSHSSVMEGQKHFPGPDADSSQRPKTPGKDTVHSSRKTRNK